MFKRIFSWLLVLALLLGMTGNVLAAESKPAVSQIVTMQNQEGVTVRLTVPGGAGSGNGHLVYQFPKELTLKGAKSLVGSEGISNLGTSDTSVSFAWTCYEDYAAETAILELSFAGAVGVYQGSITLPEQDHETIPVTIPIEEPYRYVDVTNEKVWYFPYVYAAHDAGLMNGMGQDRFVPEGHLTRAQMAMLLYRMAGTPMCGPGNGTPTLCSGQRSMKSFTATATAGSAPMATLPVRKRLPCWPGLQPSRRWS